MGLFKNIFGKGKDEEREEAAKAIPENETPSTEPDEAVQEVKKPALSAEDHAAIRRAVSAQMRGETPIEIVEREKQVLNQLSDDDDIDEKAYEIEQAPKADTTKLDEAKAKVRALAALKKQSEKFPSSLRELGSAILNCSSIYAAFDKDFNGSVPFITTDGRIEIFSSYELAMNVAKNHEDNHHGHIEIKKLGMVNGANQTDRFLRMCMHNGLFMLRLDSGNRPMDLKITDLLSYRSTGLVDDCGRTMRQLFIRQIAYANRLAKLDKEAKGTTLQVALTQAMLTMRLNGYRELGNGLLYIYTGTDKENTIFFTEEALKRARRVLQVSKNKLGDKALLPKGIEKFELYKEPFAPGAADIRVEEGVTAKMLCAFTDYEMAENLRKKAKSEGLNKGIVVVAYNEVESFAKEYEGIAIDIPSYSMIIPKKEFDNVRKCAASKGPIAVQAKKNEPNTNKEQPKENKE